MNLRRIAACLAAALVCALTLPAAFAQDAKLRMSPEAMQSAAQGPVRMIVMLAPPASAAAAANSPQKLSAVHADTIAAVDGFIARSNARRAIGPQLEQRVKRRYQYAPFLAMELSLAEASALAADPAVAAVVEDQQSRPSLNVSVPLVKADQVWTLGPEGYGQSVAIFDTGVDFDQVMLTGKIIASACFSSTTTNTKTLCPDGSEEQIGGHAGDDCVPLTHSTGCDHGTHVAGIAAGRAALVGRTTDGVTSPVTLRGVAPSASIVAVQVFSQAADNSTSSFSSDQIAAFDWLLPQVAALHVAAINMSLGGAPFAGACDSDPRKFYIDQMRAAGVLTVIAAGNDGSIIGASSPGCISSAITVGATDNSDAVASFSNSGAQLDLWAPGVTIESSVPTELIAGAQCCLFGVASGTSMSAPHVAGAIALLKSGTPTATPDQIEAALKTGPPVTDSRNSLVRPRLDALAAYTAMGGGARQPRLTVTPDGFVNFVVPFQGSPTPATHFFTVINNTTSNITARAAATNANITLTASGHSGQTVDFPLVAGGGATVAVAINSPLPLEVNTTEIAFSIVGAGFTTARGVRIDMQNPINLTTAPLITMVGPVGGPFSKIEADGYNVSNSAGGPVTLTASVDQSWATLSAEGQSGQSITYNTPAGTRTVTPNPTLAATAQGLGVQRATVTFTYNNSRVGTRRLDLRVTVPNDLFVNAATIPANGAGFRATGSNVNSFYEVGEPAHYNVTSTQPGGGLSIPARRSVWYKFVPAVSGSLQIDTIGSDFDTVLAIYRGGPALSQLFQQSTNDDMSGSAKTSLLNIAVTAGETIYIAVDGFLAATGNYVLNVTPLASPANDNFANAQPLAGFGGGIALSTIGASREAGELAHNGKTTGRSVWFSWVAATSTETTFSTDFNGNFDTTLSVYTAAPPSALALSNNGLVEVASNDDAPGAPNGYSSVTFIPTVGRTYYIAVDTKNPASPGFSFIGWHSMPFFSPLLSSVLPSSRRTVANRPVTIFANLINSGPTSVPGVPSTVSNCSVAPPASFQGTFSYQTADAANHLTGTPNTPAASIPPNGIQNFVLTATPTSPLSIGELGLTFKCDNVNAAPVFPGTNTWLLRADAGASTPDIIAIGATIGSPGVISTPKNGATAYSVAAINIGSAITPGMQVFLAPSITNAPNVAASVCETNPSTSQCLAPPTAAAPIGNLATNEVKTFSFFIQETAGQTITFDPARTRLGAVFQDSSGNVYGSTTAALRTP